MDVFKPDYQAYNLQRTAAGSTSTSSALIASATASGSGEGSDSYAVIQAAENLYRDANSFVYADHKPSEDAIDRVIGKINIECVSGLLSKRRGGTLADLGASISFACLVWIRDKRDRERGRMRMRVTSLTSTRRSVFNSRHLFDSFHPHRY